DWTNCRRSIMNNLGAASDTRAAWPWAPASRHKPTTGPENQAPSGASIIRQGRTTIRRLQTDSEFLGVKNEIDEGPRRDPTRTVELRNRLRRHRARIVSSALRRQAAALRLRFDEHPQRVVTRRAGRLLAGTHAEDRGQHAGLAKRRRKIGTAAGITIDLEVNQTEERNRRAPETLDADAVVADVPRHDRGHSGRP